MRRKGFGTLVIATMGMLLVATSARADGGFVPDKNLALHWDGSAWSQVGTPSPTAGGELNGVASLTSTDAWAVGQQGDGSSAHPWIQRRTGTKWQVFKSGSTPGGSWLDGVAVVNADNAWAVGHGAFGAGGQPIIEKWDGASWTLVADPSVPGGELHSVTVIASNDVWAVGEVNHTQTLTEHWNGESWTVVSSPNAADPSFLLGVDAVGPKNVWAVGSTQPNGGPGHAITEHWDGAKWSLVKTTGLMGSALDGVSARGSKDVFAAGSYLNAKGCLRTLVVHWDGAAWSKETTPNPFACDNELNSVSGNSTGVEAVGQRPQRCPGPDCHLVPLAIRRGPSGWTLQTTPSTSHAYNLLNGVSMVPGANEAWAVGIATDTARGG